MKQRLPTFALITGLTIIALYAGIPAFLWKLLGVKSESEWIGLSVLWVALLTFGVWRILRRLRQ